MKHLPTAARVLLGLVFFVFGLNFFLHFIPQPPVPPAAGAFAGALFASGYFFILLKVTEITSSILLLSNRYVPLALTFLAPIIVNIVAFHTFLAPSGLPLAIFLVVLEVFLAWSYRDAFRSVVAAHATPAPLSPKSESSAREHAHA